jgi:hypothetical protein
MPKPRSISPVPVWKAKDLKANRNALGTLLAKLHGPPKRKKQMPPPENPPSNTPQK